MKNLVRGFFSLFFEQAFFFFKASSVGHSVAVREDGAGNEQPVLRA
jgi:hypothetical protein